VIFLVRGEAGDLDRQDRFAFVVDKRAGCLVARDDRVEVIAGQQLDFERLEWLRRESTVMPWFGYLPLTLTVNTASGSLPLVTATSLIDTDRAD
jgi:hypothetical protein